MMLRVMMLEIYMVLFLNINFLFKCEALCFKSNNLEEIGILKVLFLFQVELLKAKSIEFISQYPERVMKTAGWKKLLQEAPDVCSSVISRLSRVGVDREVVLKTVGGRPPIVSAAPIQQ